MILKSVTVENFRSILYEVLTCESLTVLIGPNGAGKSAFLKAIDLFYNTSPRLNPEDFYNGDITKNIQITLTYSGLDDSEKKQFSKYLQNEELSIVRVLSLVDGKASDKYHGSTLQNPDFRRDQKSRDRDGNEGNVFAIAGKGRVQNTLQMEEQR